MTVRDIKPFLAKSQELADLLELDEERQLVGKLFDAYQAKLAREAAQEKEEGYKDQFRPFLEKGGELVDGERGIQAVLKSAGSEIVYDAPGAIQKRDKGLYRRLKELGCVVTVIDKEKVAEAVKSGWLVAKDLEPFKKERQRTRRLFIEPVEK